MQVKTSFFVTKQGANLGEICFTAQETHFTGSNASGPSDKTLPIVAMAD